MKKDKKPIFTGVGTALVTPFLDGKIDYPALDRLIEEQIRAGIDAIIIGGTTGEAATLTEEERYTLYEYATERIKPRAKIILGTGTNDTRVVINHTKFAESIGADGTLIVTPYYNKGTEEGIYRHYTSVADSCSIPIILYNVPSRTGVNLGINLLRRLAEHPNILGLKEAGDSVDRLMNLAELRNVLPLYAGNDSQILPVLALGGAGVISVISNALPRETLEIVKAFSDGDTSGAIDKQTAMLGLIRSLFAETNPAPIKYLLERLATISGELRLPLCEIRPSTKELIVEEYERYLERRGI